MNALRPLLRTLIACACAAWLPSGVLASTVAYDNGAPTTFNEAIDFTSVAAADDFRLTASTTLSGIRFYATDRPAGLLPNFSGTLSWFIYAGSAGLATPNAIPSTTVVAQGTATGGAITITDTGIDLNGAPDLSVAQVDFKIPTLTLGAGTYWLRIKEGSRSAEFDGSGMFWVATDSAYQGNGFRADPSVANPGPWVTPWQSTSTTKDLAFQLIGSQAGELPEPGTLALVALGGALALRRRQA